MVDVQPKSEKLRIRAKRIVRQIVKTNYRKAEELLEESGWDVKTAVVMGVKKMTFNDAKALLNKHDGFLRKALE